MKILFIILGLLLLAVVAAIVIISFGLVRCSEAQEESWDDSRQTLEKPEATPAGKKRKF